METDVSTSWPLKRWGKVWAAEKGYALVCKLPKIDLHYWHVFYKPRAEGSDWCNFKICAIGQDYGRMNYTLGWNGKRFARSGEEQHMEDNHPLLFSEVCKALRCRGYLG